MPSGIITKYQDNEIKWEDANGYSTLKEARINIFNDGGQMIEYIIQFIDDHTQPYKYDLRYFIDTPMGKIPVNNGNILIHKENENKVAFVPHDYQLKDDESRIDFNFFEWNAEDWN